MSEPFYRDDDSVCPDDRSQFRGTSNILLLLDSNLSAGLSDQGQCPRNAFSLGISLFSIARCYSRVLNE